MIRANLLPRERSRVVILGLSLEIDRIHYAAAVALIATLAFSATAAIEWWRAQYVREAALRLEVSLARQDHLRRRVASLAREVALLQQIDRESEDAHHSGNDAAAALGRIGNAVPAGVWLDALTPAPDGYLMSGGGRSLDEIAAMLSAFARLDAAVALVRIEQPIGSNRLGFAVRVKEEMLSHR